MSNPFTIAGNWYKGNLHTHTTNSDGRLTPQQAVDLYVSAGYDFLALTDHRVLTATDDLDPRGLTLIPGSELDGGSGELGQSVHVVGLGMESAPQIPETESIPELVAAVAAQCRVCFIAHPYWSSLVTHDLVDAEGHIGLEVYNCTCHRGIGRGESAVQWDGLLARGHRLLGFAVDDAHMHYNDALGGWIWLKAPDSSVSSLLEAIEAGHFYASSGPQIHLIEYDCEQVHIQCSPCREVSVIDPRPGCGTTTHRLPEQAEPYTDVTLTLNADCTVFRVECTDSEGRKAWSNPFYPRR